MPVDAQARDLAQRLEASARAGNAEALYHLGMLYNNAIGVEQDNRRAFELFLAAAEGGDPLGAYKAGCYYAGQFPGAVEPDEENALRYKLVAAEAGYALAQLDVGVIYARREDYARALPWFEAAARQGEPQALYNLSVFYKDGLGVAPSPARSHAFFRLTHLAARGSVTPGARRTLDEMWAAMDAAQRREAEQVAASWISGPSELTRLARQGLDRAERVARESRPRSSARSD